MRTVSSTAAVRITALAHALVVAVYFWCFGSSAWHPTDYEQVMGLTWRVAQGEVPYRDFLYHKPPGTIFLHTVWHLFPDRLQVRASRLFFYVQMAVASFLPVWWALTRRRVVFGWRLPLLSVSCLMLALYNFPAMPWQTTDGVLFATIGLVALAESRASDGHRAVVARGIASLALTLALLCKQSFFAPCALLALVAVGELLSALIARQGQRGSRALRGPLGLFVASCAPAAGLTGLLLAYLIANRAVWDALAQFRSQSSFATLNFYGVIPLSQFAWLIPWWAMLPVVGRAGGLQRRGWFWASRIGALPFISYLAYVARERPADGLGGFGFALFFMLVGTLIGRVLLGFPYLVPHGGSPLAFRPDQEMLLLHLGFVLIAWSCQLSLGYTTPLLGLAGLGLVLHELLPEERVVALDVLPVAAACVIIAFAMMTINYERPYYDRPRVKLAMDLGALFPKLAEIRTNPSTFKRYQELKDLVESHALVAKRQFAVTQDWAGVHWLFNDANPIACDWCYAPDIHGFEARLLDELRDKAPVIIVPKEERMPFRRYRILPPCAKVDYREHHAVSQEVAQRWPLIGESDHFCVFATPLPGEPVRTEGSRSGEPER